jgi:hypothetical protein
MDFQYLNHMHQVCARSDAVGYLDQNSMMALIQTELDLAVAASSMTCMPLLT